MDEIRLVRKDELYHYGVKGMKWGHRKNPGYVSIARAHLNAKKADAYARKQVLNSTSRIGNTPHQRKSAAMIAGRKARDASLAADKAHNKQLREDYKNSPEGQVAAAKRKKALKVGAAVAGTALAVYGARKASQYLKNEAGTRSYESGKKYVEETFFKEYRKASYTDADKAYSLWKTGMDTLANTDARTKKVSNSTKEAIKYLRHPERYSVDARLNRR